MTDAEELRRQEYDARARVGRLRERAFEADEEPDLAELVTAEQELAALAARAAAARRADAVALDTKGPDRSLGPQTSGLEVTAKIRMSYLPTAFCHLLDVRTQPLVTVTLRRLGQQARRLRVTCAVDGYSAAAVETVELSESNERPWSADLLPTFFPAAVAAVTELTRATLSLQVEDLENGQTEVHRTVPLCLLARDTAPNHVIDPADGTPVDLTRYLGAFVTPHARAVVEFTRRAADRHPERMLVGYQGSSAATEPQVRAVYEALTDLDLAYVNSVTAYHPEEVVAGQRVRLPSETLSQRMMNCLDGTVLFASILENISLRSELVLVPGHAVVGWEAWPDLGEWAHLDTTVMGPDRYDSARQRGDQVVAAYGTPEAGELIRRWPVRELRVMGITPME
ncbi:hypothetical protein [Streptomyces chartreusis]|uniref:hypothetical protein n=1 Tax=Streptomyces chartreusis TaxID=1969 RepID=UPI0037ACF3BC